MLATSLARSSPSPTKYPNAGRRETGVAAALMPVNLDDEDEDETTSFGPYADSDDDIGSELDTFMVSVLCV